jgi:hypothetical protein
VVNESEVRAEMRQRGSRVLRAGCWEERTPGDEFLTWQGYIEQGGELTEGLRGQGYVVNESEVRVV